MINVKFIHQQPNTDRDIIDQVLGTYNQQQVNDIGYGSLKFVEDCLNQSDKMNVEAAAEDLIDLTKEDSTLDLNNLVLSNGYPLLDDPDAPLDLDSIDVNGGVSSLGFDSITSSLLQATDEEDLIGDAGLDTLALGGHNPQFTNNKTVSLGGMAYDLAKKVPDPDDFLASPIKNEVLPTRGDNTAHKRSLFSAAQNISDKAPGTSQNMANQVADPKQQDNVSLPAGSIVLAVVNESGDLVPLPQTAPLPTNVEPNPKQDMPDNRNIKLEKSQQQPIVETPDFILPDSINSHCMIEADCESSDLIISAEALKQIPGLVLDEDQVSEFEGNPKTPNPFVIPDNVSNSLRTPKIASQSSCFAFPSVKKERTTNGKCLQNDIDNEEPVLEAGDLTTLLAEFEATEVANQSSDLILPSSPFLDSLDLSNFSLVTPIKSSSVNDRTTPITPTIRRGREPLQTPGRSHSNQSIKDMLPAEVIQKIRASTKRKSTQIIAEPPNMKRGRPKNAEKNNSTPVPKKSKPPVVDNTSTPIKNNNGEPRVPPHLDHDYCFTPEKKETKKDKSPEVYSKLPDYCTTLMKRNCKVAPKSPEEGKKDSGVESGNASDASVDIVDDKIKRERINKTNQGKQIDTTIYNKLPAYVTDIGNAKPKDEETTVKEEPQAELKKKKKLNLDEYRKRITLNSNTDNITPVSIASAVLPPSPTTSPIKESIDDKDSSSNVCNELNTSSNLEVVNMDIEEGELVGDSECEITPEKKVLPILPKKSSKPTNAVTPMPRVAPEVLPQIETVVVEVKTSNTNKTPEKKSEKSSSHCSSSGYSSLSSSMDKKRNYRKRRSTSTSTSRSRSPHSPKSRRKRSHHSRSGRKRRTRSRSLSVTSDSSSACSTCSSDSDQSRSRSPSGHRYSKKKRSRRSSHKYSRRSRRSRSRSRSRSNYRHRTNSASSRRRSKSPRGRNVSISRGSVNRSRSPRHNFRYQQAPSFRNRPTGREEVVHSRAKLVEERKVVFVGNISESVTKEKLRARFEKFGQIADISLHFRERGDNYGFVTYANRDDAYNAVLRGNDDPSQPKYDLCFGGRRTFCRVQYSDLDAQDDGLHRPFNSRTAAQANLDFDSLLQDMLKKKR